jgi:hypothetical protein
MGRGLNWYWDQEYRCKLISCQRLCAEMCQRQEVVQLSPLISNRALTALSKSYLFPGSVTRVVCYVPYGCCCRNCHYTPNPTLHPALTTPNRKVFCVQTTAGCSASSRPELSATPSFPTCRHNILSKHQSLELPPLALRICKANQALTFLTWAELHADSLLTWKLIRRR